MPANIPEELLDNLELDIANFLAGDSWFGQARLLPDGTYVTIPIITEDLGNIDVMVQKAVAEAGGPGICIVVQALEWSVMYKNVPGPYIEKLKLTLLGIENVPMNRGTAAMPSPTGSLKKIKATMIRAAELLQLFTPPTLTRALVVDDCVLARVGDQETGDAGIVQYNLLITAAGGTGIQPLQVVASVTISVSGNTVTLGCSTIGAAICYSLDKSNPSPRNGIIYTVPFQIQAGQTLKAQAFLQYWVTSDMLIAQF
jgi:Fn3 domain-containing protein